MIKKLFLLLGLIIIITMVATYFGNTVMIWFENDEQSESVGTPEEGSLVNGKRLPTKGANFLPYSYLGKLLGRKSVHDKVRSVMIETFEIMEQKYPDKIFVYGETSWPNGGSFEPHKTHQNGLSVDMMVPILGNNNQSKPLPTSIFNKFGYNVEFDHEGKTANYRIDYDAMAAYIYHLNATSPNHGLKIRRIIFDPNLQVYLLKTKEGKFIKDNLKFNKKRSWVRHDEHFHIDFEIL